MNIFLGVITVYTATLGVLLYCDGWDTKCRRGGVVRIAHDGPVVWR